MSAKTAQIAAPVAAFVLTFTARKVLIGVYEKQTGATPPEPADLRSPILPAIGWSVTMAVVSTVIEAYITRKSAQAQANALGAVPANSDAAG